jgi:hypothetical protein
VGNHWDIECILNSSGNSNRSGAAAHTMALHESPAQILVNELRAVGRYVDVFRGEFSQFFNRLAQVFKTRAFQRG